MKQSINITGIGGFKSPLAPKVAGLAALGFLGSLGFIPGLERLFGFTGFFASSASPSLLRQFTESETETPNPHSVRTVKE